MSGESKPSDSKPSMRRRHAAQLFKTEICKFFMEGRCESGDACSYAHEEDEVRTKPDLTRTSMCRKLLADGACNDERCRFAHSELELRATNGFFKMKMCLFAQSGKCKHGTRCRFAHTMDELRPARLRQEADPSASSVVQAEKPRMSQEGAQIDLYSLSSLPERQKSPQQESHGTGGSTATGNGGSTSGNGGSTSGNASGQSSNENSGSGNSPRGEADGRPRARVAMARMRNQNENSDESSSGSGNTSVTLVPRSEHTGSPPASASDSSSSGPRADGTNALELGAAGPRAGAQIEQKAMTKLKRGHRPRRSSGSGESDPEQKEEVTLIISNLPLYLTRGALLSMFQDLTTTMQGKFDFFHSPWDHKAGHNRGYAIINFTDAAQAAQFQQQWTNKDLMAGRGSRAAQTPLKVAKASVQGLKANIEYFSKAEAESCNDPRFGPLYRDADGNMTHLERPGHGDVESLPSSLWRKAEGLTAGHGPQDLDTGQVAGTGSGSSQKSGPGSEACRTISGAAQRSEERSLQVESGGRRRRNRRRSSDQPSEPVEAPAQVPPPEKFPAAIAPRVPGDTGVQPDLRQMALRQQHQRLLKTMEEKEARRRSKMQETGWMTQEAQVPEKSPSLPESQEQLQMLAMQLHQRFQSMQTSGMSSALGMASQSDLLQAPMPSTAANQYMVSRVPATATDSAQLALHISRQVLLPTAETQVYNPSFSDVSVGAGGAAGPPMAPMVPYMMLPVQSVQPAQSLQAALASGMTNNFNGQGVLRFLNGDEVYTD